MSSITDRHERGQILVIFTASLLVIFGVAALVFDGGMMLLEKRDQQNAADAAAIAGARFLPAVTPAQKAEAEAEARAVATINGFTDAVDDQRVEIEFPSSGRIAVSIEDTTPSFFAGIWGIVDHDVASRAVAVNEDRALGPFGLLALEPHACKAVKLSGQGVIESYGDIQVNSECPSNAMWLTGQGRVFAGPNVGCNVWGGFDAPAGSFDCTVHENGEVPRIPDPFLNMIPYEPAVPVFPIPPVQVAGSPAGQAIPSGCPGSSNPASATTPRLCRFNVNTTWRLYPGYYPGGLEFKSGNFYLEPGEYYIGGGGLDMNGGGASVISVAQGGNTLGGGVLIFNGRNPRTGAGGSITLNGGDADIQLYPRETGPFAGLVLYQAAGVCGVVKLNGSDTDLIVRGTIYAPCAEVAANGNQATIVTDQIVANTFTFTGNNGGVRVMYDADFLPSLALAGLIE